MLRHASLPFGIALTALPTPWQNFSDKAVEYLGYLSKGQLPPPDISLIQFSDDLVLDGVKYRVRVTRNGPTTFAVELNDSRVDVVARKLGDGGYLMQVRCAAGGWLGRLRGFGCWGVVRGGR